MSATDITPELRKQAQDRFETLARSLFQIRGTSAPGSDQLSQIVHGAVAGASPAELRAGGSVSAATIGRIDQLIASAVEAGKPRNRFSAEAAQLAHKTEAQVAGLLGVKAFAELQRAKADARAARENDDDGRSGSSANERGSSGARYDSMGSVNWSSSAGQAMTRAYAVSNDMGWATKEPDLMRMGKPALRALHESHLKGDGYKALRDPSGMNLDNKLIVHGAKGFMKRNHVNHNDAAKSAADILKDPNVPEHIKAKVRAGVRQAHKSDSKEDDKAAKGAIHEAGEEGKKAAPKSAAKFDRLMRTWKATEAQKPQAAAKAAAKQNVAGAKVHTAKLNAGKAVASQVAVKTDKKAALAALDS